MLVVVLGLAGYFGLGIGIFKLWTTISPPVHQVRSIRYSQQTDWYCINHIMFPHGSDITLGVVPGLWICLLVWPLAVSMRIVTETVYVIIKIGMRISHCAIPKESTPKKLKNSELKEAEREVEQILNEGK